MPLTIKQLIDIIPEWQGKAISISPVYGGITNQNFKVIVDQKPYFVSLANNTLDLLGVNLRNKYFNNKVCENLGLSPKIFHFLEADGVLITEFFTLPTLSAESLLISEVQERLVIALEKLHNGPHFKGNFDIFNLIEHYLKIAKRNNIQLPLGFADSLTKVDTIRNALKPFRKELVPCHNDLIAENIMDDGHRVYLIDFDYSGQNDLYFELGNLCVEAKFNDIQSRKLLKAYFGRVNEEIESITYLNGMLSDIGWSLWSFIQTRISDIDFDFVTYGLNRWERVFKKIKTGEVEKYLRYII